MDRNPFERTTSRPSFIAASVKTVDEEGNSTDRLGSSETYLAAPTRIPATALSLRWEAHALALVIIMVVGLAVVPELITHLNVKHRPDLPPMEDDSGASKFPLAHLASFAGSAALLMVSCFIVWRHKYLGRDLTGALIVLLAVNLPYFYNPVPPQTQDLVKIALANAVVLALWKTGASIAQLKWLPIIVTGIGAYSLVGGLVMPDYMMYQSNSIKAIIFGWELAGPFGHGNVLGLYCGLAFALIPLIPGFRWRILCASILFATIVASASRTAVIAAVMVMMWWTLCRFRSVISIRLAGTVLASVAATAMAVVPFLNWNPHAFSDRATVWASAMGVWQHSPIFGLGVNWFLTDARATGNVAAWAYVGTGHNIVIDIMVKTGLVGVAIVAPIVVGAISSTRALRVTDQQIACFGFLMAFFVAATTEAVWALLPNLQLFPISGLIFAMLILTRHGERAAEGPT